MYHASHAGYNCGNRQGCLSGTRRDVLGEIECWLTDGLDRRIFWLNGLAGTGKSTIAQTFAESCFAGGKLGASFFCSRDFVDRSNLQIIFPTLAFQLAYKYPPFRKELLPVLRAIPDVGQQSLCSQMEKLIVGPFKTAPILTLIVIDALDECKDEEPASTILSVLSRYVDDIPNVKFFITGRPEPQIRSGFRLKSIRPITEVLKLHNVERTLVDGDIGLYFRVRLTEISEARSDCDFREEWPSPHDINLLCKKAAGLFIYASTVIKFVASRHYFPTERLNLITSLPQSTIHEGRSEIDPLYAQVLEQAFAGVDPNEQLLYSHFKTVLGAVVLAFNPLSVRGLSDLLGMPNIYTTLHSLHSLLLVPDPGRREDPIRIFHKSFPDFLTDSERCGDKWFFVDTKFYHAEILLSCLKLMDKRLKKNICSLDDYVSLDGVEDLFSQRRNNIESSLEYACKFWSRHLLGTIGSTSHTKEIEKAINDFSKTHLLHWIEVLVLLGNLDVGIYAMNDIKQWCAAVSTADIVYWTVLTII